MGKSNFDFGDGDDLGDDIELASPLDFSAGSDDDDAPLFDEGFDFGNVDLSPGLDDNEDQAAPPIVAPPISGPGPASDEKPDPLGTGPAKSFDSGPAFAPEIDPAPAPPLAAPPLAAPPLAAPPLAAPPLAAGDEHGLHSEPGHTVFESAPRIAPKKPLNMTLVLGVVAGVMIAFAALLVMTSGSSSSEIALEEVEEPVYTAPIREVVRVRTSPPALRVLVNGQSRGTSPVELRLSEADYPLTITAVLNQSTSRDQVIREHQPEVFLDLSDLIR